MRIKLRYSLLGLLLCSAGTVSLPHAFANPQSSTVSAVLSQPEIASGSALVIDMKNRQVIYSAAPNKVVPIASITKLMTAMVVLDKQLPLSEVIPVTINQTHELEGVYSRVKVGSEISREDMLLLALMSSENRAAAALAHNYPGGYHAFIQAMNDKAQALGMTHTHYVEPTGLSEQNVSTASDLTKLLFASQRYPLLSQLSTTQEKTVTFQNPLYTLDFRNTNYLVKKGDWDIQLTKTGFTNKAGHCLAMRTTIANRDVTLVVLDAFGKYTHFADANRLRKWMETGEAPPVPAAAKNYKKQKSLETTQR
ncbi:D-alanyl-D-alanine endopeptidase [Limnobaculum zhutongyuii]|uniref:D-alanyl-D-alanine endopeptidase n=1 Tax=Limnobaculum zhutongyuii TaxID=2498113 RepID=A0A411WKG5_9GAMM|nr:D-alanyl-D-alanine endopeptidase [Limnobaculum zhutongyuii]QBH96711.1 D-alanyl-D-alanine endopeptidase [Limnobaculum zhutongyuii]TQS90258.1 D-alanyl-D-alanine endopeptidase [Limnobaculum zhutongyuii]